MKIIISAYACEPQKGSEPEVGWRWSLEAAKIYTKVVVLTRKNNKKAIEKELHRLGIDNIKFQYFDLPKWLSFWKKGGRGIQIYAYLWEVFSFFYLVKFYKKDEFDVSQRVTFVSYRFPSFLWYFGKEFILGPIAGGERFPLSFLKIFSFKGKVKQFLRIIAQRVALIDPLVLITLYKANEIIAVTEDTKSILPNFAQKKTSIKPAISIDKSDFIRANLLSQSKKNDSVVRLLYVGRLLEWKGLMLVLRALKDIPENNYEFNIIGSGNDKNRLLEYSEENGIHVNFLGQIVRSEISKYYHNNDLFIFPSLHDSGGMVVLEAKAHDLPCVVSSFGGPKQFVDENDVIIDARSPDEFVTKLTNVISQW